VEKHFMHNKKMNSVHLSIITAGANYLDIDAYACMVALSELLRLQGENAVAWSAAAHNYSVCPSLVEDGQILRELPSKEWEEQGRYIIVDVSDPEYLQKTVPLENVVAIYDHHVGVEKYWADRIGKNARIEFIGAAATLIYREWKKAGLQDRMTRPAALLLIAAILDNTLNLTSANTTQEDRDVFRALCAHADVNENWCAAYFSEVQVGVESDLQNALRNDTKTVRDNPVLPEKVAQLCVWDAESILRRLPEIRGWFEGQWMLNLIDMQHRCSWFVCDDPYHQEKIGRLFDVLFVNGVAKTPVSYLRKEIIKKTIGG
jgi:inorganic pyrophosphatase/manganese-dependent inorganic pyrophosphatase